MSQNKTNFKYLCVITALFICSITGAWGSSAGPIEWIVQEDCQRTADVTFYANPGVPLCSLGIRKIKNDITCVFIGFAGLPGSKDSRYFAMVKLYKLLKELVPNNTNSRKEFCEPKPEHAGVCLDFANHETDQLRRVLGHLNTEYPFDAEVLRILLDQFGIDLRVESQN